MKIKLLRIPGLIFCVIVFGLNVKAQSGSQTSYFLPQPFPRSPTATALEMYGTYQVNEYTGVPDISIPLYTVEAGGFQVPITLSYHASGNKVTDVASWAGLGWSVSAGGQITRRAMGLPDDVTYGYLNGYMYQPGTYNTSTYAGVYYLEQVAKGLYDSKPDIYSYDFPGHGGKFFFDGSVGGGFTPRMLPYAPISIKYKLVHYSTEPDSVPPISGLTRFNIADEHGNNYTFGDAATEITYPSSGGTSGNPSAAAWKLESMISQNRRDTISFSYQSDMIYYPTADAEIYTVIDQINPIDTSYYNNASYNAAPTTPGNVALTEEQLPKQINFKNGRVVFDLDSAVRRDVNVGTPGEHAYGLKDIKVYQYNYGTKVMELQKTILFYKTYFPQINNPRLRLDSIQILDKAGSIIQHYRFDYNMNIILPQYTDPYQDYWGYYNGQTNNNMLTPKQMVTFQPYTIDPQTNVPIGGNVTNGRNCDSNYMQAFVLTGIHYPTGGYTTFTYQTNQYYISGNDTVQLAGGLRIRTISSYDGINPTPIVKTYVYNSARRNFFLDSGYFFTSQVHRYYALLRGGTPYNSTTEVVRSYSNTPHCDLEPYDAATVVYPSVTEYIGTPGNNVGRTDYTFTNQQDAISDASMAGNLIYISSFYARGKLTSKNEYIHLANGSYQIVKADTNTYTAFPYTNYNDVGLAVKKRFYNEGPVGANPFAPGAATPDDSESFDYPYYYITSDDNYLTATTTRVYDTNDPTKYTTSGVSYVYGNIVHQQVTHTYHTDSKGNTLLAVNRYPADYSAGNAIIDSMVNRNMQAEIVEKFDTLENVATSVNAVTSGQFNLYKSSVSNTIVPSKISTLSVAQPLTNFAESTVTSGALTSDSRYVQMISFDSYDSNNNITQYTPRNATTTSIIWDYQHELPIAQVKNAITTNAAYTSFEADGNGGWTFSGKPVFDPTAPTGKLVYPLSAGNVVSPVVSTSIPYVLSYWSKGAAATISPSVGSPVTGISANGWTYYEYQVPTGTSQVTISGTTSIDELRLYPAAAQMTTYAYDPSGLRSISDTKGTNSYFEYDYFQRLRNIKDWNGNIVKNYGYHTYDQIFGNQLQTASISRNNCPYGYTPGALTYTVPANKYYSSTQASANADAIYDMNTNGQIKANANCSCTVTYISVSVTNSTGLANYPIYFSGITAPFNVPTGVSNINVPEGNYTTVTVGPLGSGTYNFTMGTRPPQNGVHYAVFNSVSIAPGSSDLTLTIN